MRINVEKALVLIYIFFFVIVKVASADELTNSISLYIESAVAHESAVATMCYPPSLECKSTLITKFYSQNKYMPIWSGNGYLLPRAQKILNILQNAYSDGLNPADYHLKEMSAIHAEINAAMLNGNQALLAQKIAQFDLTLTDAAFLYSSNLSRGKIDPGVIYPQWKLSRNKVDLMTILNNYVASDDINSFLYNLLPHYLGYAKLKKNLAAYQSIAIHGGWPVIPNGPKLLDGAQGERVKLLQQRLLATGELDVVYPDEIGVFDARLKDAVIKYQLANGIVKADGIVGRSTLTLLNVPVTDRIRQIELNMDRLRYLPEDLGNPYIMVNIPDYSLHVLENNTSVLDMAVIIGQAKHQSCVLNSKANYLELNPYWNIPRSIAVNEILPKLWHDPKYLEKNNIAAFAINGKEKVAVDASKINWSEIESSNFSYQFRQEPGDENALGRVKFVFPNNCGIYLHDTDMPQLFAKKRRDFSHGCIRIAKPMELATYLLQDKKGWGIEAIESAIDSGDRRVVMFTKPVDIHVIYATAFVNESGVLQFRNDIYGADKITYPVFLPNN